MYGAQCGVRVQVIARGTPGFSGADLANLINIAALKSARDGLIAVRPQHAVDNNEGSNTPMRGCSGGCSHAGSWVTGYVPDWERSCIPEKCLGKKVISTPEKKIQKSTCPEREKGRKSFLPRVLCGVVKPRDPAQSARAQVNMAALGYAKDRIVMGLTGHVPDLVRSCMARAQVNMAALEYAKDRIVMGLRAVCLIWRCCMAHARR